MCNFYAHAQKRTPELTVAVANAPVFRKAFSFAYVWEKQEAWWESVWVGKNGFSKDSKVCAKGKGWLQTLTDEHSTCPSFAAADFWELKMILLEELVLFWSFLVISPSLIKAFRRKGCWPRITAVYSWEAGAGTKAILDGVCHYQDISPHLLLCIPWMWGRCSLPLWVGLYLEN